MTPGLKPFTILNIEVLSPHQHRMLVRRRVYPKKNVARINLSTWIKAES